MQKDKLQGVPVFFILGRERSGTTLLRTMLDCHPQVLIPPEFPFFNFLWSAYHKKNYWTRSDLETFVQRLVRLPAFHFLNADSGTLKQQLLSLQGNYTFPDLCRVVWLNYRSVAPKTGIRLLGDKNLHYSLRIPRLLEAFPDARFIQMIRDPRGNVQSMMEVDFESHLSGALAYRWLYYNRVLDKSRAKNPDQFLLLKYEDLVTEPEPQLKKVCHFLGISWDQAMLGYAKYRESLYRVYPPAVLDQYQPQLFHAVNPSRILRWREKLSPSQIRKVETVSAKTALSYGYETPQDPRRRLHRILIYPEIFYGWLYLAWGYLLDSLPFGIRMAVIRILSRVFKPWWLKK